MFIQALERDVLPPPSGWQNFVQADTVVFGRRKFPW
jgi:hypothetical protein